MLHLIRPLLDPDRRSSKVQDQIERFHRGVVDEVAAAVDSEPLVVVGMAQNPHVKKTRSALDKAQVAYRYLEYGSYLNSWRRRLAIKMWSGYPTFPQVFVRGVLYGGNRELQALLKSGELHDLLERGQESAAE